MRATVTWLLAIWAVLSPTNLWADEALGTPRVVLAHPPAKFEALWQLRREALLAGDPALALRHLESLRLAKISSGWPSIPAHAAALVMESRRLRVPAPKRAEHLAGVARVLAPHLPATHLAHARALVETGDWDQALLAGVAAFATLGLEPPLVRELLRRGFAAIVLGVCVAVLLFVGGLLFWHHRTFLHGLGHILPGNPGLWHCIWAAAALLLTPLLFGLGLACTLLVWLAAWAPFYTRRERFAAAATALLLLVLPAAIPLLASVVDAPQSWNETIYSSVRHLDAPRATQRMADRLAAEESDLSSVADTPKELGSLHYALGLRARWSGQMKDARRHLEAALAAGQNEAELHNTLGSTRFALGDVTGAVASYAAALKIAPNLVEARFNLSRLYLQTDRHRLAGELYRQARALDYDRTEFLTRHAKRAGTGFFAEAPVPTSLLAAVGPKRGDTGVAKLMWHRVSRLSAGLFAGLAGLVLCVVFAFGFWPGFGGRLSSCSHCSAPACRFCKPKASQSGICVPCSQAVGVPCDAAAADRVSMEAQAPPALRLTQQITVRRVRRRRSQWATAIGSILVGGGPLLRGSYFKGGAILSLYVAGLAGLASSLGWVAVPLSLHPWIPGVGLFFSALAVLVSIATALRWPSPQSSQRRA